MKLDAENQKGSERAKGFKNSIKPVKRAAVIHDLCGVGKAAMTNIIPILSVMGIEACPVPTMILSTHTGGFGTPVIAKNINYIRECAAHYKKNHIFFDLIILGYLGSKELIGDAVYFLDSNPESKVVLDPIFGDHGRCYSNFDLNYTAELRKILHYGDIITPNYTEACLLCGEEATETFSEEKILRLLRKLSRSGAKKIVITSVPAPSLKQLCIAVYENETANYLFLDSLKKSYPGTGDIFTSVLSGEVLNGSSLTEACIRAHQFVFSCILESCKSEYPAKEGVVLEKCLYKLINIS